jgi:hypothetical protein
VPDRRLALSSLRTRNLRSFLLTLAVTPPALGLVAVTIGTAGATSASAASVGASRPASVVSAHLTGTPAAAGARFGARVTVVQDGFAQPLAAASPAVSSSSDIGRPLHGHTGKPVKRKRHGARAIARSMLRHFGWWRRQFKYLNLLWNRESSWNVYASNPYSGAYGIPQAVPGSKMASAGAKWRTSARTQIRWGLRYIKGRYGSPARAWDHELATGWY